jgi:hypothetical protein
VAIYRDESLSLSMRLDAAKSAVKFEWPALASTMVTQKDALDELSLDELQQLLALAEAAVEAGGWEDRHAWPRCCCYRCSAVARGWSFRILRSYQTRAPDQIPWDLTTAPSRASVSLVPSVYPSS